MKAIILNASAWMIVPVMDAFAKYLSSSMDVLQITWARYFFTSSPNTWHGMEKKTIVKERRCIQVNYVTFSTDWKVE